MVTLVFSLYDSKAKSFGPPFFLHQRGQAIRALGDLVKDGQSMVSRHPEDFVLYHIGEFNDSTGEYINKNPHDLISMASDFKEKTPEVINLEKVG